MHEFISWCNRELRPANTDGKEKEWFVSLDLFRPHFNNFGFLGDFIADHCAALMIFTADKGEKRNSLQPDKDKEVSRSLNRVSERDSLLDKAKNTKIKVQALQF